MRAFHCSARCRPSQVAVKQQRIPSWGVSKMSPVGVVADDRQHVSLVAESGSHGAGAATYASKLPDNSALAASTTEQKQQIISDAIRGIPDFPKPGILFWDVTTLLLNPQAFQLAIDLLVERYRDQKIDVVAGMVKVAAWGSRCWGLGFCNSLFWHMSQWPWGLLHCLPSVPINRCLLEVVKHAGQPSCTAFPGMTNSSQVCRCIIHQSSIRCDLACGVQASRLAGLSLAPHWLWHLAVPSCPSGNLASCQVCISSSISSSRGSKGCDGSM